MFQLWFTPGRGKLQFAGDFPTREAATKEIRRLVRAGKAKDAYWRIEQKRTTNPIHRVRGGWKWGKHGHVYPTKAGAERQMRAIFASGYRERNPGLSRKLLEQVSMKEAETGDVWNRLSDITGGDKRKDEELARLFQAGMIAREGDYISITAKGEGYLDREPNPGRGSVHTAKWDRCFKDVKAKGGAYSPAAVCTAMLGEKGSIKPGHRRKNPEKRGDARKYLLPRTQELLNAYEDAGHVVHVSTVRRKGADYGKIRVALDGFKPIPPNEAVKKIESWLSRQSNPLPPTRAQRRARGTNPSGFDLEKTQRVYFMVHAHKGRERLWLTPSGTLSADKARGSRYAAIDTAVARAKAFLKRHPSARSYRFDICLAE